MVLLYAARPNAPFWCIRTKGYNHIYENGTNQWRDNPDKNHNLIEFMPEAREEITRTIDQLMSKPPER
jgi:hypothetical protein